MQNSQRQMPCYGIIAINLTIYCSDIKNKQTKNYNFFKLILIFRQLLTVLWRYYCWYCDVTDSDNEAFTSFMTA